MFLGVDGGGTKTAFCLLSPDGEVVASAVAPSAYATSERGALLTRVLEHGVSEVCAAAGLLPAQIAYAFFGLPGYGEARADLPVLDATPLAVLGHARYACDNDMVCGWAGSLGTADGINVISGTGSMAYGEHAARRARTGGWGQLFGDEGSAHWIAVRGLAAFARMSDGRLPRGPLHRLLREHLGVDADLDVVAVVVNEWGGRRREVAALSRVVVDAAAQGDTCSGRILLDAAAELAAVVDACRRRLRFAPDETVPVSYSGGVFGAEPVRAAFGRALADAPGDYDLRTPLFSPVVGAALYAAKLAGTPLADVAVSRLRTRADLD